MHGAIFLCSGEKEAMLLEWKRVRRTTFNPSPFRPTQTCLPICHMPPYHQSTPNPRSWGLATGRPRGAACQQFLAEDQNSRRESRQQEAPKPAIRSQKQKCTSFLYVTNLPLFLQQRIGADISWTYVKFWKFLEKWHIGGILPRTDSCCYRTWSLIANKLRVH
jgi:hypothetical protein